MKNKIIDVVGKINRVKKNLQISISSTDDEDKLKVVDNIKSTAEPVVERRPVHTSDVKPITITEYKKPVEKPNEFEILGMTHNQLVDLVTGMTREQLIEMLIKPKLREQVNLG